MGSDPSPKARDLVASMRSTCMGSASSRKAREGLNH